MSTFLETPVPSEKRWHMEVRWVVAHGVRRPLRLVRFATGWLASADTAEGPTLGADRSPYLAARRALEPLGVNSVEAMRLVGPIR